MKKEAKIAISVIISIIIIGVLVGTGENKASQEKKAYQKTLEESMTSKSTAPGETEIICDPSYPSVCIPSPPPILKCVQIQYRNFVVLAPDPHNFDSDKDGMGCNL